MRKLTFGYIHAGMLYATDTFTFSVSTTDAVPQVRGLRRYGVIATETSMGNTMEFFVVIQDTEDEDKNEMEAIVQARHFAMGVINGRVRKADAGGRPID